MLDWTIFRLKLLRHKWRAWRQRRKEDHENRQIARLQKEYAAAIGAWEDESRLHSQEKREMQESFARERRELESQLNLKSMEVVSLEEVVARNRARVAAEAACEARKAEEYSNGVTNITK